MSVAHHAACRLDGVAAEQRADWRCSRRSQLPARNIAAAIRRPEHSTSREQSMQANLRKVLVAVALITPASSAFADVIADWNEKAIAFVTPRMTPPAAQRVVAMVQVAMFDAVNSIERRYRPYLVQLPAPSGTSKEAAAAAAAATIMATIDQNATDKIKVEMETYLVSIPESAAKLDGIKLGREVAASVLQAR